MRILTGPRGASWWSLTSPEVVVDVVPDGYTYTDRKDEAAWAAQNLLGPAATRLAKYIREGKVPGAGYKNHGAYAQATTMLAALRECRASPLIIVEQGSEVTILDEADGCLLLERLDEPTALDWEWRITDRSPLGLAVSTASTNYYIRGGPQVQKAFGKALSKTVILHGGRADLGTQLPDDPVALEYAADDTQVMAYLIGENDLHLKYLTRKYLGRTPMEYPAGLENLPIETQARYAAAGDTRNTFDLYWKFLPKLVAQGQAQVYEELERPLVPIIASMEKYGSPLDMGTISELEQAYTHDSDQVREAIEIATGFDVSTKEGVRGMVRWAVGYDPHTASQEVLSRIEDGWIDTYFTYSKPRNLLRSFLRPRLVAWEAEGRPDDFRAYCAFNQAGSPDENRIAPRSGRLSSSALREGVGYNLQNQPEAVRAAYVGPYCACCDGRMLSFSYDYKTLELMIAGAVSRDPALLDVFSKGGDVHGDFQARIQELTGVDVGRTAAKAGIFGRAYGGQADMLQRTMAKQRAFLSDEVAKMLSDAHESIYQVYHAFTRVEGKAALARGYGLTLSGRRGYPRESDMTDPAVRDNAVRFFVNMAIQGTAADIVKRAMLTVVPILLEYDGHLARQVHDELAGWCHRDSAEVFNRAMKEAMESIPLPGLRLRVTGGVGENWLSCK